MITTMTPPTDMTKATRELLAHGTLTTTLISAAMLADKMQELRKLLIKNPGFAE